MGKIGQRFSAFCEERGIVRVEETSYSEEHTCPASLEEVGGLTALEAGINWD